MWHVACSQLSSCLMLPTPTQDTANFTLRCGICQVCAGAAAFCNLQSRSQFSNLVMEGMRPVLAC
jgi:hypothetical protein